MNTLAIVLHAPGELSLERVALTPVGDDDVVVSAEFSGVSTGTERLLWTGRMPAFPGMGYPLVPGYETVGRVVHAGPGAGVRTGERVFVPGARCYADVRGLFGADARTIVAPGSRVVPVDENLGDQAILLALAATARHALAARDACAPDLIVGHGVLGRLLARIAIAMGHGEPVVWEKNPDRRNGAVGYKVIDPADDDRRNYRAIYDVSGDPSIIDSLISRLAPGGEIVLAGFYEQSISFAFAPAFMREARLRIAAEWKPEDMLEVRVLLASGMLNLDQLITHRSDVADAGAAYRTAFEDPLCLKMVLDWRECA
ncbi:MAG: chlorophyll synthesis pathway protein BchC [Beijerinckiaceae bacterium]